MKYGHRVFIYGPFVLFVLVAIGAGLRWWQIADAYSATLDRWNGHEVVPGVTLHFASKKIAGFPFNLDTVFKNVEVDIQTPHGPLRWRTPDFAAHALTYGRAQTIFEAAGLQKLDWTGVNGKHRSFVFLPGSIHADAIKDDRGVSRVDVEIAGLGSLLLTATQARFHLRLDPQQDGIDVFTEADGMRLSPQFRSAFGNEIRVLRVQGTLLPGRPFDGLRAGRTDWVSAAEAFRNAGGVFAVDAAQVQFATFDAMGKGRLTLDDAHQPSGLLDFRLAGFPRFVDWMHNHVADHEAGMVVASALLDRATKAGSDEAGEMGVVLSMKDGVVAVGDEPAGTLSPLY